MRSVAPGIGLIDLHFQGQPEYIACYVLETSSGVVLVDPGPTSTLGALTEGLRLAGLDLGNVTDILLTHIHLDHAGATGTIVRQQAEARVHVHVRGARHMASPERLLASATRLYGDRMDTLWGEFAAVPQPNLRVLEGGESLTLGGRHLEVAYTPGHASHHVSYFEADTGTAWVGDTLGIRIDNRPYVMPVAPPPDIDLDAWRHSHALIREWRPETLAPTHFGPARPAAAHIDEHEERLARWSDQVAEDVRRNADQAACAAAFRENILSDIALHAGVDARQYSVGGGLRDSWYGMARYFRKQAEARSRPGAASASE